MESPSPVADGGLPSFWFNFSIFLAFALLFWNQILTDRSGMPVLLDISFLIAVVGFEFFANSFIKYSKISPEALVLFCWFPASSVERLPRLLSRALLGDNFCFAEDEEVAVVVFSRGDVLLVLSPSLMMSMLAAPPTSEFSLVGLLMEPALLLMPFAGIWPFVKESVLFTLSLWEAWPIWPSMWSMLMAFIPPRPMPMSMSMLRPRFIPLKFMLLMLMFIVPACVFVPSRCATPSVSLLSLVLCTKSLKLSFSHESKKKSLLEMWSILK